MHCGDCGPSLAGLGGLQRRESARQQRPGHVGPAGGHSGMDSRHRLPVRAQQQRKPVDDLPAVRMCASRGGGVLSAVPCAESIQRAVSEPVGAAAGAPREADVDLGPRGICRSHYFGVCRRVRHDVGIGRRGPVLISGDSLEIEKAFCRYMAISRKNQR